MYSVVLVTEFTNFYDEQKALEFNNMEKPFNEYLVSLSSQFLEIVSANLKKYGGDLIQFMGYSLVAIWPGDEREQTGAAMGREGADANLQRMRHQFIQETSRKAA